jgi:hypothetical protein
VPTQRIKRSVRARNYENHSEVWPRIDFCNTISRRCCWPSKTKEIAGPVVEIWVVTVIEKFEGQLASSVFWQVLFNPWFLYIMIPDVGL